MIIWHTIFGVLNDKTVVLFFFWFGVIMFCLWVWFATGHLFWYPSFVSSILSRQKIVSENEMFSVRLCYGPYSRDSPEYSAVGSLMGHHFQRFAFSRRHSAKCISYEDVKRKTYVNPFQDVYRTHVTRLTCPAQHKTWHCSKNKFRGFHSDSKTCSESYGIVTWP